jgi:eukaryotic-like serine/threonine-protein kinase
VANADRIIDLLHEAKARPAGAERLHFLAETCRDDSLLKEQILSLLEAEADDNGTFLKITQSGRLTILPSEKPGDRIDRYKLLEQIGEGGCGVVYVADQEEPVHRRVALKVIKLGMDTKQVVARFDAERQALAMMDHPNIAKVLDAGSTDTGRPYFVMELVRGIKITDYCDQHHLSTRARLDLFIQVCHAIQHAHQKGIMHRDIKPSNILVASNDGVPVPKVIDFGIAKATQGRLTDQTVYTAFDQFIGTPAYMSPEQAEMSLNEVDTRTDIYSLGVLLYELLTGKTPFDAMELVASGLETMRRTIREKEPERPSTRLSTMIEGELTNTARQRHTEVPSLIHLLRGDLDWIVMKCLEKARTRRYETANALAMDIHRHLQNEPIMARPPSAAYRLQKAFRRNKLAFCAASAVAAALVIGLGLSTWLFVKERQTRQRAETAEREQAGLRRQAEAARTSELRMREQAEEQALAARRRAYASDMNLLQKALADDDLGRAQILLDRQRPRNGEQDLRGWEWRYFWQLCRSDAAFTLCQRSQGITSVSFSSQGDLLAVGARDGEVTVWEIPSRQVILQRPGNADDFGRLAFSPTGDLLAYYDGSNPQKAIVLWNSRQRAEVRRLSVNNSPRDLAFTRDGELFSADVTHPGRITAWDVSGGAVLFHLDVELQNHGSGRIFSISDDGLIAAYALKKPGTVRLQELKKQTGFSIKVTDEYTTALAFGRDGQILATGSGYSDGAIKLWNAQFQALGSLEGHRSWVSSLKMLPDGMTLASASADHTIRLWDLKTRRPTRTLRGQNDELWTMDVSPDGRWLASGCRDGSVCLFDISVTTNRAPPCRTFQLANWADWRYSPDGAWVGALRRDGHLLLGRAATPGRTDIELTAANIQKFVFAPDSRWLAAGDRSGHLTLWDIPGQRVITNRIADPAEPIGFTADGKMLWTYSPTLVKEWDTATWQEIRRIELEPGAIDAVVCPEAGLVCSLTASGSCEIITIQTPEKRRHFNVAGGISGWCFSPGGKLLALASELGTVELWDTGTVTRTALLHGVLLGYHSVSFSLDGERLVAGSNGQEAIKVWDLHSLQEVATLRGQGSMFRHAKFSPNGDTIGAQNMKSLTHFWSAPSWPEIQAAERGLQTAPPR